MMSPRSLTTTLAGAKRAMNMEGTNFVNVLNNYSGKRFRTAVQNFYASFLAARHVAEFGTTDQLMNAARKIRDGGYTRTDAFTPPLDGLPALPCSRPA